MNGAVRALALDDNGNIYAGGEFTTAGAKPSSHLAIRHAPTPTPVPADEHSRPRVMLHHVVPNPFNPRTTVKFDLPEAGPLRLSVFDLAGRLVRTLVDESMPQGSHEAVWDGRDGSGREVGSGSYLARLQFGGRVETVRMVLLQ